MRRVAAFVLALTLAWGAVSLLAAGQKLVMKDGTYQLVRSYERRGDRVRYFSLERNEWEEVPAALVDWPATEKASREEGAAVEDRIGEVRKAEKVIAEESLGPEIAPGLRLPDADGVFVVDAGKVVPLPKQLAAAHVDKGRVATNVLLPVPLLKNRSLVEIPGASSTLRLNSSPAALFANGRATDDSRYVIARLKPKGDKRQVEAILTNILGRNPQHSGEYIELKQEPIAPDAFRLIPARALEPGEYAVLEFMGKNLNLYVWNFAIGSTNSASERR